MNNKIDETEKESSWQDRLVRERDDVDVMLERLNVFLVAEPAVSVEEKNRLFRQRRAMEEYRNVLAERISAAFPGPKDGNVVV